MKIIRQYAALGKWSKIFLLCTMLYLLTGILLGLFTPDNVVEYGWARALTGFVAGLIPFVAKVGRVAPVASIQFIAALMNIAAIIYSVIFITGYLKERDDHIGRIRGLSKNDTFINTIGALFVPLVPWFIFFKGPVLTTLVGSQEGVIMGSKLGMGLYGSIVIAAWCLVAYSVSYIIVLGITVKRSMQGKRDSSCHRR